MSAARPLYHVLMASSDQVYEQMASVWEGLRQRFPAYELLLPGSPTFVCLAEACPSHCCKIYSVSLGEREVERMKRFSGLEMVDFVECEEGRPITLPLAQPYLLARREGTCALLGHDLRCGQYEGRPDACRLYPHFVIVIRTVDSKPIYSDVTNVRAAVVAAAGGGGHRGFVPLLLRHLECPGFSGPPLAEEGWRELIRETARLQYEEAALA